MIRVSPGYRLLRERKGFNRYAVLWGLKSTRPCLMAWALQVARRMRMRGHDVTLIHTRST